MPAINEVIHFHMGPKASSGYFFVEGDGRPRRKSRVTMTILGTVKEKLEHRRQVNRPVTDMSEFLATFFPIDFIVSLEKGGISVVEAWNYMGKVLATSPALESPKLKSLEKRNRKEAERLARILATVTGEMKAPEAIITELFTLIEKHLPQAMSLLREWADTYGYSQKGGYIIVGNRANRNSKKASIQAA